MFRLYAEVDQGYQLVDEFDTIPKGFELPANCRLEVESSGLFSVVEDILKSTEEYVIPDPETAPEKQSFFSKLVGFFK